MAKVLSSGPIGVAVPTTHSCVGSGSGWSEVFSSRTRRVHQIIRADVKFLHHPQAVGENLFRANAVADFRQSEIAVADQTGFAQNRQHRHGRARVQRGHAVAVAAFFFQRAEMVSG